MAYAALYPYYSVTTGVLIVLKRGGQRHYVLLERAAHMMHPGKWGSPGGYTEAGVAEAPVTGLLRELAEELGPALARAVAPHISPANVAYVATNWEDNPLFGHHPDARKRQASLHLMWVVAVDEATAALATNADPGEHTALGLHGERTIFSRPQLYVPWLPGAIRLLEKAGRLP